MARNLDPRIPLDPKSPGLMYIINRAINLICESTLTGVFFNPSNTSICPWFLFRSPPITFGFVFVRRLSVTSGYRGSRRAFIDGRERMSTSTRGLYEPSDFSQSDGGNPGRNGDVTVTGSSARFYDRGVPVPFFTLQPSLIRWSSLHRH